MITLYVTQVLYTCMYSFNRWIERKMHRQGRRDLRRPGGQLELMPVHGRTPPGGGDAQAAD